MDAMHVPSGGAPVPCLRERLGRCRICELIDPASPDYSEPYRRLFEPGPEPQGTSPVYSPESSLGAEGRRPGADFRRERLIRVAALACLYREPCGCNLATCYAGRGPGPDPRKVFLSDCVACLSAADGVE